MEKKKKVKKKLSIKGVIVVFLFLYLIIMLLYAIYSMPIRSIIIKGNNLITDQEIIKVANINTKSSLWRFNSYKAKKKLKELDLISEAKITKNILGTVTINVTEEKVLLNYVTDNTYILSNNEKIKNTKKINGIPTLINFVPSDILEEFIKRFQKIDNNIIAMISEIEYDPDVKGEITIDDGRFLLKMNDENSVYVNIVNLEKLNKYKETIATLANFNKGLLYLDSSFSGATFETYDTIKANEEKEANENGELPE